jgi:hypothetical protein
LSAVCLCVLKQIVYEFIFSSTSGDSSGDRDPFAYFVPDNEYHREIPFYFAPNSNSFSSYLNPPRAPPPHPPILPPQLLEIILNKVRVNRLKTSGQYIFHGTYILEMRIAGGAPKFVVVNRIYVHLKNY